MAERNTVTSNKRKPKSSGGTPRRGDRSKLARNKIRTDLTENDNRPADLEPDGNIGRTFFTSDVNNPYDALSDADDSSNMDTANDSDNANAATLPSSAGLILNESHVQNKSHATTTAATKNFSSPHSAASAYVIYDTDDSQEQTFDYNATPFTKVAGRTRRKSPSLESDASNLNRGRGKRTQDISKPTQGKDPLPAWLNKKPAAKLANPEPSSNKKQKKQTKNHEDGGTRSRGRDTDACPTYPICQRSRTSSQSP